MFFHSPFPLKIENALTDLHLFSPALLSVRGIQRRMTHHILGANTAARDHEHCPPPPPEHPKATNIYPRFPSGLCCRLRSPTGGTQWTLRWMEPSPTSCAGGRKSSPVQSLRSATPRLRRGQALSPPPSPSKCSLLLGTLLSEEYGRTVEGPGGPRETERPCRSEQGGIRLWSMRVAMYLVRLEENAWRPPLEQWTGDKNATLLRVNRAIKALLYDFGLVRYVGNIIVLGLE